jgi:uncharacterized protein YjgD (DUF1641 family)
MAGPITFKPLPVDPHQELMHRVEAAPREHAEALLVAWDLLQTAHDQGILDLAQGLLGGRNLIAGKLAEAGAQPESVAALRNLISLGRLASSLDPDMLQRFAREMQLRARPKVRQEFKNTQAKMQPAPADERPSPEIAKEEGREPGHKQDKPLSLWQIFKTAISEDGRRGMGFALGMLTALGRANRD